MTPEQIARELPFVLVKQDAEGLRQLHAGGLNINACTHTGLSLLQDATLNGKLITARTLVELGADVNAQGGTSQMTALHFAVQPLDQPRDGEGVAHAGAVRAAGWHAHLGACPGVGLCG